MFLLISDADTVSFVFGFRLLGFGTLMTKKGKNSTVEKFLLCHPGSEPQNCIKLWRLSFISEMKKSIKIHASLAGTTGEML
jgi:hypothetical protein